MQRSVTAPRPVHAASRPLRAIGLMCVAWVLFACLDTTVKYLGTFTPLPASQVIWMRFLGQFLAMVALLGLLAVPSLLRTRKLAVQLVRSLLMLASTAFNFLALRHLRLDQTTTIGFLTPLTVALLAGPLLGEWIGWRRAIGIAVGFAGILLALRPGVTAMHPAVLLSLAGMLCYAVFSISTRYLAPYDRAEVTLFYSLLAGSLIVAPFALAEWVWPADRFIWLLLLSMGAYGGLGHYLFILAHRYAPASTDRTVPLPHAADALDGRLSRVRPGARCVDSRGRRHRDPVGPLPVPARAHHRARCRRRHDVGGRAAAVKVNWRCLGSPRGRPST